MPGKTLIRIAKDSGGFSVEIGTDFDAQRKKSFFNKARISARFTESYT
jgi:hypothetical protein